MEAIEEFFSTLILWTAGIAVVIFWIIIIVGGIIETYDLITGNDKKKEKDGTDY